MKLAIVHRFLCLVSLSLGATNAFSPFSSRRLRPVLRHEEVSDLEGAAVSSVFSDTSRMAPSLEHMKHMCVSFLAGVALLSTSLLPLPAQANSRVVGEIQASGLVFKDALQIESFDDPKIKGVTLYISNFQRPITERLNAKNMFSDPSYTSVACAKTGPVSIADNVNTGVGGEEVFEESRSILFKTLRVQRIYDQPKNTVIYVSYTSRLNKNDDENKARFKSALCAVNLDEPVLSGSSSGEPNGQ